MRWFALWTLVACGPKVEAARNTEIDEARPSTVARGPATAPPAPIPEAPGRERLIRALSVRDPAPSCETIDEAAGLGAAATLIEVAETVESPPWAGMRAAACVTERHVAEGREALSRWVAEERFAGLARVVISGLEAMPEADAVQLAREALNGPAAAAAKAQLGRSERPALRALVTP